MHSSEEFSYWLVGVICGVFLSFVSVRSCGTNAHEYNSAEAACGKRGGYLHYSASAATCKDGSVWMWREGYIVRKQPGK